MLDGGFLWRLFRWSLAGINCVRQREYGCCGRVLGLRARVMGTASCFVAKPCAMLRSDALRQQGPAPARPGAVELAPESVCHGALACPLRCWCQGGGGICGLLFLWGSRCYGRFGANLTADLELGVVRAMGKVLVAPPWVAPRRVPPNARSTDPLRPDKGHVH